MMLPPDKPHSRVNDVLSKRWQLASSMFGRCDQGVAQSRDEIAGIARRRPLFNGLNFSSHWRINSITVLDTVKLLRVY